MPKKRKSGSGSSYTLITKGQKTITQRRKTSAQPPFKPANPHSLTAEEQSFNERLLAGAKNFELRARGNTPFYYQTNEQNDLTRVFLFEPPEDLTTDQARLVYATKFREFIINCYGMNAAKQKNHVVVKKTDALYWEVFHKTQFERKDGSVVNIIPNHCPSGTVAIYGATLVVLCERINEFRKLIDNDNNESLAQNTKIQRSSAIAAKKKFQTMGPFDEDSEDASMSSMTDEEEALEASQLPMFKQRVASPTFNREGPVDSISYGEEKAKLPILTIKQHAVANNHQQKIWSEIVDGDLNTEVRQCIDGFILSVNSGKKYYGIHALIFEVCKQLMTEGSEEEATLTFLERIKKEFNIIHRLATFFSLYPPGTQYVQSRIMGELSRYSEGTLTLNEVFTNINQALPQHRAKVFSTAFQDVLTGNVLPVNTTVQAATANSHDSLAPDNQQTPNRSEIFHNPAQANSHPRFRLIEPSLSFNPAVGIPGLTPAPQLFPLKLRDKKERRLSASQSDSSDSDTAVSKGGVNNTPQLPALLHSQFGGHSSVSTPLLFTPESGEKKRKESEGNRKTQKRKYNWANGGAIVAIGAEAHTQSSSPQGAKKTPKVHPASQWKMNIKRPLTPQEQILNDRLIDCIDVTKKRSPSYTTYYHEVDEQGYLRNVCVISPPTDCTSSGDRFEFGKRLREFINIYYGIADEYLIVKPINATSGEFQLENIYRWGSGSGTIIRDNALPGTVVVFGAAVSHLITRVEDREMNLLDLEPIEVDGTAKAAVEAFEKAAAEVIEKAVAEERKRLECKHKSSPAPQLLAQQQMPAPISYTPSAQANPALAILPQADVYYGPSAFPALNMPSPHQGVYYQGAPYGHPQQIAIPRHMMPVSNMQQYPQQFQIPQYGMPPHPSMNTFGGSPYPAAGNPYANTHHYNQPHNHSHPHPLSFLSLHFPGDLMTSPANLSRSETEELAFSSESNSSIAPAASPSSASFFSERHANLRAKQEELAQLKAQTAAAQVESHALEKAAKEHERCRAEEAELERQLKTAREELTRTEEAKRIAGERLKQFKR